MKIIEVTTHHNRKWGNFIYKGLQQFWLVRGSHEINHKLRLAGVRIPATVKSGRHSMRMAISRYMDTERKKIQSISIDIRYGYLGVRHLFLDSLKIKPRKKWIVIGNILLPYQVLCPNSITSIEW